MQTQTNKLKNPLLKAEKKYNSVTKWMEFKPQKMFTSVCKWSHNQKTTASLLALIKTSIRFDMQAHTVYNNNFMLQLV